MFSIKNKRQIILLGSTIFLITLFLLIFHDFRERADEEIDNIFILAKGEVIPDTNIIIIHFSEEDIARIGPWPIKRNYYALLIKQLSNLGVKKIGLEIFLSSRFVTQAVYDNLLRKEIEKSGKVILSSVAGKIIFNNDNFFTDSLSFPSPKLLNENIVTGHVNYLLNYNYKIPLVLISGSIQEKAFAYQLSETQLEKKSIIVNFVSSWQNVPKYSVLEFAELVNNQSSILRNFKDKFVLIGISDQQIAPTFQTAFDEQLPGIGLHAFALDNLLNSRYFNDEYYFFSILISFLIFSSFIIIRSKIEGKLVISYIVLGIAIFLLLFLIITVFYLKISTSTFILSFISMIVAEAFTYFVQERKELKGAMDEATLLRNLLSSKEKELTQFQKELNESGSESLQLVKRIESLQQDIQKLQENEDDKLKAHQVFQKGVEEFYGLVYNSSSMARIVELIKKAAPTDSTILISGESGTGKELVAKAIHSLSKRKEQNFVTINCGALTDSLLESELFGHIRGSFTGAISDKLGRFELADKGTIFLDEIGETSENFQVKMLRVLQSGEIEKVGSTKVQKVDVRVIAATNKNLSQLTKEKNFREDLYYRLNVITIDIPPLRERKEDVNVLAEYFLHSEAPEISFSKAVMNALNEYEWKGNVRELESIIKRAVIFARSEKRNLIQLSDLPKEIVKEARYSFEDLVLESLRNKKFSHSSITETAKELGDVNRTMISENFRGIVLKLLFESEFNIEKTVSIIAGTEDENIIERVRVKTQTFLNNIQNDLAKTNTLEFEVLKKQFSSKYKNLPVKFHYYLDEVVKWQLSSILK